MFLRIGLIIAIIASIQGCRSRPFQVIARGAMAMSGDVKMDGQMEMKGDLTTRIQQDNRASHLTMRAVEGDVNAGCRVVLLDVDGLLINKNLSGLGSMGENPVALFREKLQAIERDPTVRALVLRINSPGGGVTASDMMRYELASFKQRTGIPVVACILDVGAGGAYYLATVADTIVAHPTSLVGGIGVLMNVYNLEDTLNQFNIASIPIKAGSRIDVPTTDRTLEKEEKAMLQSMADIFHKRFQDEVVRTRPYLKGAKDIFDGRVIPGVQAKELRLVDDIGYIDDAIRIASHGLQGSPSVVMLRRDNDRAYTTMDVTPNAPWQSSLIPVKVPGLDRSSLPTFLYLWQADPSYLTAAGG